MMKKSAWMVSALAAAVAVAAFRLVPQPEKDFGRTAEQRKNPDQGAMYWDASWFGAGGRSEAYYFADNKLGIAEGVNSTFPPPKEGVELFFDSVAGSGDSLLFDYKYYEFASWTWCSFFPRGYRVLDLTGMDCFVIDVKGRTGDEKFSISFYDNYGNESKDISVGLFTPKGRITTNWQRAYIPFSKVPGMERLRLDGFKMVGMAGFGRRNGKYAVYIDNMAFIRMEPGMMTPEVLRNLGMVTNPEAYLDHMVLYDWETSTRGWIVMEGNSRTMMANLRVVPIQRTTIPEAEWEGRGEGVLSADLTLYPEKDDGPFIQRLKDEDWSEVQMITVDVWVPPDAPKGIIPSPFLMTSEQWRWHQPAIPLPPLEPGKWNRVRWRMDNVSGDAVLGAVKSYGLGMYIPKGSLKTVWKGKFYYDNWTIWGTGLKTTPRLLPQAVYDQEVGKQTFTMVDLRPYMNRGFADEVEGDGKGGWTDQGPKNDFRDFKFRGVTKFLGIPFDIVDPALNNGNSVIATRGQNQMTLPTRVEIPIGKTCGGIYFLHASGFSWGNVGSYTFVYEDGTEYKRLITDGMEIFNWWGGGDSPFHRSVWNGSNPTTAMYNMKTGIGVFAWINPHPDRKIEKVVIETPGQGGMIFLVAMTLTDKVPFLPALPGEPFDFDTWFAWELPDGKKRAGTALDFSGRILDPPAGKHGHVVVRGNRFYFPDGRELRLVGINLTGSALVADKPVIDLMVEQIAQAGFNLVRLHHLEADFVDRNIFGKNPRTTRKLDPKMHDNFQYLCAKLIERGIYLNFNCLVSRVAKPDDGYKEPSDIVLGLKSEAYIDPFIWNLNKEYLSQVLLAPNPYMGGKRLIDHPAVVMMEIINEDTLYYLGWSQDFKFKTKYYQAMFRELWNRWLRQKYRTREELERAWAPGPGETNVYGLRPHESQLRGTVEINTNMRPEFLRPLSRQRRIDMWTFMYDTHKAYYDLIADWLRKNGAKCLLTGSNHWEYFLADLHLNAQYDFVDRHMYFATPWKWLYDDGTRAVPPDAMVTVKDNNIVSLLSSHEVYGKPFTVSEWNACEPNAYRADASLIMAAYASLRDWVLMHFDYGRTTTSRDANFSIWSTLTVPHVEALAGPMNLLMFRKDVTPATAGWYQFFKRAEVFDPFTEVKHKELGRIGLVMRSGVMFEDVKTDAEMNRPEVFERYSADREVYETENGELRWDFGQGLFRVNAARNQGFAGFPKGKPVACRDVRFDITTDFAVVNAISLDDRPIAGSRRILVTAVARARQKGMRLDRNGAIETAGELPAVCQPVLGRVFIRSDSPLTVYHLTHDGQRAGKVPVSAESGGYSFELKAEYKTLHYEVVKE